ncbi:MAG: lysyl oxidase family protein, partial [Actinomycetota bacterium]|nr:lysyl oxidase family protein [Actinomycetota bacterium]
MTVARLIRTVFVVWLAGATALSFAGGRAFAAPRRMLPNLRPLPPTTFFGPRTDLDPSYVFGGAFVVEGCTGDEVVRKSAQRCLRFDTAIANVGRGPLEVAYVVDPFHPPVAAHQRIYRTNGSFFSRFATETEYHPTHVHFHIRDVYVSRLWRSDSDGESRRRKPIARSDKNGFCPEDTMPVSATSEPEHYQCYGPQGFGDLTSAAVQIVGISSGWADLYPSYLPDQYIEISDVRDG